MHLRSRTFWTAHSAVAAAGSGVLLEQKSRHAGESVTADGELRRSS